MPFKRISEDSCGVWIKMPDNTNTKLEKYMIECDINSKQEAIIGLINMIPEGRNK